MSRIGRKPNHRIKLSSFCKNQLEEEFAHTHILKTFFQTLFLKNRKKTDDIHYKMSTSATQQMMMNEWMKNLFEKKPIFVFRFLVWMKNSLWEFNRWKMKIWCFLRRKERDSVIQISSMCCELTGFSYFFLHNIIVQ